MRTIILSLALLAAGCAYRPIVDPKNSDMARFDSDLAECRQIAAQAPGAGTGAAAGAAGGFAVGALLGHATGRGHAAGEMGRGGAVLGGAGGAGKGKQHRDNVVRNCLKGRGHAVLN